MSVPASKKAKVSRVDLKINPDQKQLLERAASLKGLSLSAYVIYQSLEAAKEEIAAYERLVLSDRDRDLFLSLMANPPEPGAKLKAAMNKFQDEYETEVQ